LLHFGKAQEQIIRRALCLTALSVVTLMIGSSRGYSASGLACDDEEVTQYLANALTSDLAKRLAQQTDTAVSAGLSNENENPIMRDFFINVWQ
jgi:hypothetical protein